MSRFTRIILIVGVILADQLSKYWAEHSHLVADGLTIIPNTLTFQLVHNYGAAYGIFSHQRVFLITVSIVVIVGCSLFFNRLATSRYSDMGITMLIAGSTGNLIDRLYLGYVIDFINIHIIPVFNIADITINIAVICLFLELILKKE